MPDLLIVFRDNVSCFELEELGKKKDFRVKTTAEIDTAAEWLKLRPFDVFFIDSSVSIEEQQHLAEFLWRQNPLAVYVSYNFEQEHAAYEGGLRLFGAEVAAGKKAWQVLNKALDSVKPRGLLRSENFKIMVVEDLDSPRDIICLFLEGLGYTAVKGVSSVKEALQELEAQPDQYSCIVTDMRMPELTGKDLIETVRSTEQLQHLPVIVLTAYGTADALIDCLKVGASGFLVKPPKRASFTLELSRAMRIIAHGKNPRLVEEEDIEQLREVLEQQGIM